jgi:hypothetical protein
MELTTVVPDDVEWVAEVVDQWDATTRWGLRGLTPPPGLLNHLLWDDVTLQKAVKDEAGRPAGLLQLEGVNFRDGVGRLGLLVNPQDRKELGTPLEGFVRQCFDRFPLRKLSLIAAVDSFRHDDYCELPFRHVGTFKDHESRGGGRYCDVTIHELGGL